MPILTLDQVPRNADTAETPAARQISKRRPSRIVRRVASSPLSFYNWLSGPPMTNLERSRATLADARNLVGRGTLLG